MMYHKRKAHSDDDDDFAHDERQQRGTLETRQPVLDNFKKFIPVTILVVIILWMQIVSNTDLP